MITLYSDDYFPSGKYKSQLVGDVALEDPYYLHWWQSNMNNVCISDELLNEVPNEKTDCTNNDY